MNIVLNGDTSAVTATCLADVLVELGFADAVVATAVNGEFVSADRRNSTELRDGDTVEVLAPMQGG